MIAVANGHEFLVEVDGPSGPSNVSLNNVIPFDGVRRTIEVIAGELAEAWKAVAPDEAVVEFGIAVRAKEGKLTGLLVSGGGEASLKVTLKWLASQD